MATTFIYALCEPGTRTVRYIGKTANLMKRFRGHLRASVKKKSHLGCWLRSLAGVPPNMVMLREVPEVEGSAAEIKYIRIARESLGMKLVNATDGGEGTVGVVRSAEYRAKQSAAQTGKKNGPHTPETRAKMSAASRGRKKSPEARANMSAAKKGKKTAPLTPERKAKISAALKGKKRGPHTAEARAKQSAAQTGKKLGPRSAEHCAKLSAALKGKKRGPYTAERGANISAALRGKKATLEARANMSAAKVGKPWSAIRRERFEKRKGSQ